MILPVKKVFALFLLSAVSPLFATTYEYTVNGRYFAFTTSEVLPPGGYTLPIQVFLPGPEPASFGLGIGGSNRTTCMEKTGRASAGWAQLRNGRVEVAQHAKESMGSPCLKHLG